MTPEIIERAETMHAEFNRHGDHDGQRIMEAALRALRPEPPVAWRWHWIGGDEPDVWAYSETMPRHSKDVVCEPLYAVPPASPVAQPQTAKSSEKKE